MLQTRSRMLALLLVIPALAACGEATPDPALLTEAAQLADQLQTEQAAGTASAATVSAEIAETEEAERATQEAVAIMSTNLAATEISETAIVQERATATAESIFVATSQAVGMSGRVDDLLEAGHLDRTEGTYARLPDFNEEWAQINWYQWWPTGYSPSDFVIRADISWDSASDKANWFSSGCGFVYHVAPDSDHLVAYLGLDGFTYFARNINDRYSIIGRSFAKTVNVPAGGAEIMLVSNGSTMHFFVDGERAQTRLASDLRHGELAYTLNSGTNKGYGIRCQMEDVELWELAPAP